VAREINGTMESETKDGEKGKVSRTKKE